MIPLRDSTRSRSFPLITICLIVINLYIYFVQATSSRVELQSIIVNYALIPAHLTERLQELSWTGILYPPLITSTFLHGSWFHVLFNMLYLWVFGDNIEDKLGRFRFLIFYLLSGIGGNIAHILTNPASPIPLVGASGAIAGVLGAYFITFPRARVTSLIFILFFITIKDIPAVIFLFIWFVIQVLNGIANLGMMGNPVAYWAHIGGFVVGILLMLILRKKPRPYIYP
ncbi:rhomboid family intramembrane serine protease [Thermanaerosceptrum fracticalcis]|uniref:Rhomboid family intramembrane serine protease n=1 Tax=Thermanaerosceptrum fracticalcis TaxID=1712410 RepID=A0A7G6E2J6_THEFR|nr:rhomboid family intramembrane serine protease [Thermanaerosceptrum fracticalcis]QNB46300.1 rhomboid family intramembrane serine protease [Thermanaerosceptrum fracticalcis]